MEDGEIALCFGAGRRPEDRSFSRPRSPRPPPAEEERTAQADAITAAVRQATEQSDHVTTDQFNAALAALEGRLTWRFAGAMAAQAFAIIGAVAALMRLSAGAD